MNRLHDLINTEKIKPRIIGLTIRAAVLTGLIERPSYEIFKKEFKNAAISKSTFDNWQNPNNNKYDMDSYIQTLKKEFESYKISL